MPDSVQVQIENAVASVIKSLQLAWPPADQIRAARLPWDVLGDGTVVVHPGITIYPAPAAEAAGTNLREDIGYGVGIAFILPASHWTSVARDMVPAAKEAVRRKLIHDRLSVSLSGGDFCQVKIAEGEVNVPREAHRYEVSGLLLRGWMREPRT